MLKFYSIFLAIIKSKTLFGKMIKLEESGAKEVKERDIQRIRDGVDFPRIFFWGNGLSDPITEFMGSGFRSNSWFARDGIKVVCM